MNPVVVPAGNSSWLGRLRLAMSNAHMTDVLAETWSWARNNNLNVTGCQLQRVFPRREGEFLIEYNVDLSGADGQSQQLLLAELIDGDLAVQRASVLQSLRKSRRQQLPKHQDDDCVDILPDPGLLVRLPGLDQRLPGLGQLKDTDLLSKSLAGVLACEPDQIRDASSEILGHRLGKRCIARCRYHRLGDNQEQSMIVKLYKVRGNRGTTVFSVMKALWENGWNEESDTRVPRPLLWCQDSNSLWMEDVKATPLPELPANRQQNAVNGAGRALARLHRTQIDVSGGYTNDDEICLLDGWVQLIWTVFPDRAERLSAVLSQVRSTLRRCQSTPTALVHRDFYEKQILVEQNTTTLIDFDTLCQSDPALDIGNFLAHLRLLRLQGFGGFFGAEQAFLDGYGNVGVDFGRRIDGYTAATLLRLACLYSFWPRWSQVSEPLLEGIVNDLRAAE